MRGMERNGRGGGGKEVFVCYEKICKDITGMT